MQLASLPFSDCAEPARSEIDAGKHERGAIRRATKKHDNVTHSNSSGRKENLGNYQLIHLSQGRISNGWQPHDAIEHVLVTLPNTMKKTAVGER